MVYTDMKTLAQIISAIEAGEAISNEDARVLLQDRNNCIDLWISVLTQSIRFVAQIETKLDAINRDIQLIRQIRDKTT